MRVLIAVCLFVIALQPVADAGLFRRGVRATTVAKPKYSAQIVRMGSTVQPTVQPVGASAAAPIVQQSSHVIPAETLESNVQAVPAALDEVNAARARRGLRPFLHDPQLTLAAQQCAQVRASRRIAGHLANDFAYLPPGSTARSAGCGAMEPSWGWGTCCTYENYTYAGAAWVMGADGKRYMHLFVR